MAAPWLALIVKTIPWVEIARRTPEIIDASRQLLEKSRRVAETQGRSRNPGVTEIADRVRLLEQRDVEHAKVVEEVVEQLQAVADALQVLEARSRRLFYVVIVSFAASLAAIVVAMLVAAPAAAAENGSFETVVPEPGGARPQGWTVDARGYDVAVVTDDATDGRRSLRLSRSEGGQGFARATQSIAPAEIDGNRVRIRADIRTDAVDGGAGLWVRVESPAGLLYVDGMQDGAVAGTSGWTRREIEAPMFAAASRIELGVTLRGRGTAWFDAVEIDGYDTRALPAPSESAQRYLHGALDVIEQNSIRRAVIDWPPWRARVLDQARGAAVASDTYIAIRYALGALGDHHSYLTTPTRVAALREAPVANARTGRAAVPPRAAMLDAGIGYLWIPGFAGGPFAKQVEFAEGLQQVIARLDTEQRCGFIVDLRDNSGGNVWPMLAGIGPLIGEGVAAAAVYPDGRRVPLWYRNGQAGLGDYVQVRVREPYRLRAGTTRVAVLQGRETASSGEVIAAAFRGAGEHRSFGGPTRGLAGGNRTFPLPDGAAIVLTVAATSDRTGSVHLGPLAPDELAAADDDAPLLAQRAVRTAVRWLEQQCGLGES